MYCSFILCKCIRPQMNYLKPVAHVQLFALSTEKKRLKMRHFARFCNRFCILPVKMAPVVPTKTYTVQCKYWVTKDRLRIKSRMTIPRMAQGRKYINFASWVNNGIVVQNHWALDLWRPSSFLPPVMMRRTSVILTARKQLKKGRPCFLLTTTMAHLQTLRERLSLPTTKAIGLLNLSFSLSTSL